MRKSWTHRVVWRRTPAVLMLAMLLLLCWCIPVRVTAEEVDNTLETPAPDLTAASDPVDIATVLTPPAGSAEIVEVEVTDQDTNQLENLTPGGEPIDTEFQNDPASVTIVETFEDQTETDDTIPLDAVPDETAAFVTETQQTITEAAEEVLQQVQEAQLDVNVDVERVEDTLIRTTVTESENAIQKAVSEALFTTASTVRFSSRSYSFL